MKVVQVGISLLATIAILTGLGDLVLGVGMQTGIGINLSEKDMNDPILNSQIRYLGAIWLGYGILLLVCLRKISTYGNILQGALVMMCVGGFGRVFSLIQQGLPETQVGQVFVVFALFIELVVAPALIFGIRSRVG